MSSQNKQQLHVKESYELPESALGGISFEDHLHQIRTLDVWINDSGICTKNTRIARYIKFLELLCKGNESPDRVFSDPESHPFKSPIDRIMYVLREVHELMWINAGLRDQDIPGVQNKLATVVGGSDFAALDQNSASRNAQFELRIASYFARNGYELDLSIETDIIAKSQRETFYVECKRISSEKQLHKRTKEAASQLRRRIPKSRLGRRFYGVVALDVTKIAYPHNGMTIGITADHSRDILRDALVSVSKKVDADKIWRKKEPIIIWLQIHISNVILNPPQTTSRFSIYGISNPNLGGSGRRAVNRIVALWPMGVDPAMSNPPQPWPLKRSWTIPEGTKFWWSESLEDWLRNGSLPNSPDDEVVGELINENTERFVFDDLKWVAAQAEADEIVKLSKSDLPGAAIRALVMMHAGRHRYVDLDEPDTDI